MPQFESGSTKKLSISGIVVPPQVKPTIGDDIANLITTAGQAVKSYETIEKEKKDKIDLENYNQQAILYAEAKRQYIADNANAITADEKRKVFVNYSNTLDALARDSKLSDKYQAQMMASANNDIYYASAHYESVLDAEEKANFQGAMATIITATEGLPLNEKIEQYNTFLDASTAYRMTRAEASEAFTKTLVNSAKVSLLTPGTTYQQAVQKEADVLEILGKDKYNQGKPYIDEAKVELLKVKNSIANDNKVNLSSIIASVNYNDAYKIKAVEDGVSQGWLDPIIGKSLVENIKSDATVKYRNGVKALQVASLSDMTLTEEAMLKIAYNPEAGRTEEESRALAEGWRANRKNFDMQIELANFDNVVNSTLVPPDAKISALKTKIATETNPLMKTKYEAQLVKAENELADDTIKYHENLIKNKKGTFEQGLASARILQEKGLYSEADVEKVTGDLLTREEARIKKVEAENQDIEAQLLKGATKVFKAHMANKDKSPDEKISIIDKADFLTQAEKDMYKSLVKEGKNTEFARLLKENKKLDIELAKDRATVLNAIVKNKEYPLAYKIKKINESKDLGAEEKKYLISQLKDTSYKAQVKEFERQAKEEQTAYRNVAKQYATMVKNGDYTINEDQWGNAIARGWANKDIDATVWGEYVAYKKEKDMFNEWSNGVDVSHDPRYDGVTLKKIPKYEEHLNSILSPDLTTEKLDNLLQLESKLKQGKYPIDKETASLYRTARILTKYDKVNGLDRFKESLKAPEPNEELIQTATKNLISKFDIATINKIRPDLRELAKTIFKTGLAPKEAEQFISDVVKNDFIEVDREGYFSDYIKPITTLDEASQTYKDMTSNYYVPRASYISNKRDYNNLFRSAKAIYSKEVPNMRYAYPTDFTDMENTSWVLVGDGAIKTISNDAFRLKIKE